jgi:DNA-3-methyladenine glycosylase II
VEPTLVVTVESTTRISARVRKQAGLLVQRMLGLAVDLQPFYRLARDNAVIGPLVERFAGVRPPRFRPSSRHWSIRSRANRCPLIWESSC